MEALIYFCPLLSTTFKWQDEKRKSRKDIFPDEVSCPSTVDNWSSKFHFRLFHQDLVGILHVDCEFLCKYLSTSDTNCCEVPTELHATNHQSRSLSARKSFPVFFIRTGSCSEILITCHLNFLRLWNPSEFAMRLCRNVSVIKGSDIFISCNRSLVLRNGSNEDGLCTPDQ